MKDSQEDNPPKLPSVTVDWELYASYLDESDLSDEQKKDFIESMWAIMLSFVDLGFGIHPVQQACEQGSAVAGTAEQIKIKDIALIEAPDVLDFKNNTNNQKPENQGGEAVSSPSAQEES